jgi:hypothetical protein
MRFLLIATLFTLPVTPALADGKATFSNGGTVEWTRDCVRGGGKASCTIDSVTTGPAGNVWNKTRVRNSEPGRSVVDTTVTGPNGESRTRRREVTWGN